MGNHPCKMTVGVIIQRFINKYKTANGRNGLRMNRLQFNQDNPKY